ncbi:MAG: glycerophosphodiester phosphodiesterase [Myxococcales bacterium]|nr:glycerophosphodiester phosphodiesterase [Myxococcales bacterium]
MRIAHRAGLADAPENSLQAMRTAAAAGFEAVELDVRAGPDGPVCAHDADQVAGAPRLQDALRLTRELGLWVELDVKTGVLGSGRLVREVAALVRAEGEGRVWLSAFQPVAAWQIRRIAPELPLGWPVAGIPVSAPARWLGASVLAPRSDIDLRHLRRWQEAGWLVEVWVVEGEHAKRLQAEGFAVVVDGKER